MTTYGALREDVLLQPVSGKGVPVYKGEVLRIQQEVGGECVDFNCYNLHDYREYMAVGHMRRQGFRIGRGDYVLSAPPRSNLMMLVQEMPDTCVTDLLGSRCSPDFFEATWGFERHTNCQDTFAETIGAFGLTPDDTHDSFNMWMNTGWNDIGHWTLRRNSGKQGDAVDLLALMDVLAVPIVCGSGDISGVSNFFLKPIRVQAFESSAETHAIADEHLERWSGLRNQRSPDQYHVQGIKIDRELTRDPDYEPQFVNFPLETRELEIELTADDYAQVERLKAKALVDDDQDAVRTMVMSWYVRNRSQPNPFSLKP